MALLLTEFAKTFMLHVCRSHKKKHITRFSPYFKTLLRLRSSIYCVYTEKMFWDLQGENLTIEMSCTKFTFCYENNEECDESLNRF